MIRSEDEAWPSIYDDLIADAEALATDLERGLQNAEPIRAEQVQP